MTDITPGGRFDPRFNPAFQPGYDPSAHAHAQAQARPSAEPKRTGVPELIENPIPMANSIPIVNSEPSPSRTMYDDPREDQPVSRRFDPYLSGLWALSIVFVAAGLLTVRYIADRMERLNTTAGTTAFDYNLVLVYTIAAPLLVILGLATGTATLFLLASRRR